MQPGAYLTKPLIKICCVQSIAEARTAIKAGASAIGLVSAMPSGPGVIDEALIAEIASAVPAPVETFLLTSEQIASRIIEQHHICRTTTIQLVDQVEVGELVKLRQSLPDIRLVQVIHVVDDVSLLEASSVEPYVDAMLLDSGNVKLDVKQLGGTGRVHDWAVSRRIVTSLKRPVFLAGGLKPENVAEAIAQVQPDGLDVCSGVRTEGLLDQKKLNALIKAAFG